ncbi:MAG TPA: substrate-binding domain-containing protein [Oscillospiraceae bacterium]|nr:substrate-binding domain-containing protein [Oscillospiraceae bacterium]
MKKVLAILLAIVVLLSFAACGVNGSEESTSTTVNPPENPTIRLSTTTSVNDSGLLPYLMEHFEKETGYKVEITSNGTGAAIALGESGDCDLLLVHSKAAEEEFISKGFGLERIPFMYNFFVMAGPENDPAKIAACENAAEAFALIAEKKETPFVSRGDDSGTHKAELKIWAAAETTPNAAKDNWYIDVGSGMGDTLNKANELSAYVLTDKGTFLSMAANLKNIKLLLEKGDDMMNTYSLIAVNPEKHTGLNTEGASVLIKWMTKASTLELIDKYGAEKYGQQLFYVIETTTDNTTTTTESTTTTTDNTTTTK